ncbi:hypothetical protein TNCV_1519531 [Trichonephila clavipes]|nr:hypothetical protein TNCV_1519531 [Trichonephila clavipes]
MSGRNMRKLIVSEALKYMRQLSENESENDNDEEIVSSDDECVPPDEENISSDEDTVSNFPVQCISRKITLGKKKQCVNKRKKLSDSNLGEMNSGNLLQKVDRVGKASSLEVECVEELLNIMFTKKRVAQPVMQLVHDGYL